MRILRSAMMLPVFAASLALFTTGVDSALPRAAEHFDIDHQVERLDRARQAFATRN